MLEHSQLELARLALNTLTSAVYQANVKAGWYKNPLTGRKIDRNVGEMLMLIVTEISEGMEGHRKNKMDDHLPSRKMIEVELADAIIRILDLGGYLDLDLGGAFVEKILYNGQRADHKLENRAKSGGKIC
jgi:hypothetical protein